MSKERIKPNPVLGEWFDHGCDYITKYQALDVVAESNETTEMTLRCYDKIVDGIYKIPPADVKPVVRGEWICTDDDRNIWMCSVCIEEQILEAGTPRDNDKHFCPNCGADLRKETGNE